MGQGAILSAPAAAPVPSKSLPEARTRSKEFFRMICREMPWISKTYFLEEVITVPALRRCVAEQFRAVKTADAKVVDLLLFKGNAEMTNILGHHFQRHHLITKYVSMNYEAGAINRTPSTQSAFLTKFYSGSL